MVESIVADEEAAVNGMPTYSDFELDVMDEIKAWAMLSSIKFADSKDMVKAFWGEKLDEK